MSLALTRDGAATEEGEESQSLILSTNEGTVTRITAQMFCSGERRGKGAPDLSLAVTRDAALQI